MKWLYKSLWLLGFVALGAAFLARGKLSVSGADVWLVACAWFIVGFLGSEL